jgi:hypothetical protein
MAGMRRDTRAFLRQVAIICVGLLLTDLVKDRFGWTGVLILLPIAFAAGFLWPVVWRKWEERGAIK